LTDYELMMVLSPDTDEQGITGVKDRLSQFITQRGGAVTNQANWGLRRLAYPIRKFREGNYVLTEFTFEPGPTKELEGTVKVWGEVLRYLLVKKDS